MLHQMSVGLWTAINLGEISLQIGNLDEAKMLFQEADFLCRKYNLHFAEHLKKSKKEIDAIIKPEKEIWVTAKGVLVIE